MNGPTQRKGFSLSEIMIATVLLVLAAIPVMGIFQGTKESISRADERREKRYFLNQILAHAQRHSLQTLWDAFGPYFASPGAGYMRDRIAETDADGNVLTSGGGKYGPNPLGLTDDFMKDLKYSGYEARIRFEFYPRKLLGVTAAGPDPNAFKPNGKDVPGPKGLLHMQAGFIMLSIRSINEPDDKTDWRVPVMCPAIVGRPGLKMEGCPALDTDKRKEYGPKLIAREGSWESNWYTPLF